MDVEPMSLGSPQQSNDRLSKPGSQTFLPNFLIGSSQSTPTVTRSLQSAVSPKSQTPGTPGSRSESQLAKPRLPDRTEVKSLGPPVASLNALFSPPSPHAHNKSVGGNASMIISEEQNTSINQHTQNGAPKSPTQLDPFFQNGGRVTSDPTWITIFGFPSAAEAFIIRQFRQYGVIVNYIPQTENANWIHVQYSNKMQAQKALSKNGKIIDGNIMIGVIPCIVDPGQEQVASVDMTKFGNTFSANQTGSENVPPRNRSVLGDRSFNSFSPSISGTPTRRGMRRMHSVAGHSMSTTNHYANETNAPKKDNSFMGKTMSLLFGDW
ncbi:Oidioi.mRNA.OKI2018_I69.chr1.g3492.t1.cds [Oikopleura dioica]|uniref:Nucleoporin NUP53 n=1 Tax=Oikopleura dioica TaxID=34765 RepID=A0ABN7SW05_OIKDI|nr:Oidioi.mRNA.OKI2018_I69.chr1.g3492.t1.cds [Oikopleura dioica]